MKRTHNKYLAFTLLLALVASSFMGCSSGTTPEPASEEKVLVVAHTAEVTTWDPSSSFSTEVTYLTNIYETLLRANPEGSAEPFSPLLAADWDISADGLEWTFSLREGVTFHDGEKLTAQAVKDSIERTRSMKEGASFIWAPVTSIDVVDEMTVTFVLSQAVPLDRIVSSGNGAWITSSAAAAQGKEWFEEGQAIGSGPYKLDSYKPGEEVSLVKFDDYWGGWNDNQYDRVVVKIISEAVVQRQLLEAGDVQIASVVPVEAIPVLEQNPDIVVYRNISFYNYLGFLNTAKPPLDNKLVRQAVSYATNYTDIINIATGGNATQAQGPVPAGLWPWHPDLPQYTQNLDKARELLVEAGYPEGRLDNVKMVLTHAAENPGHTRYAPLLKEALAEIGIDLEVRPILWAQQWAMAKESDPATEAQDIFLLFWWPTYADGYDNLSSMFTEDMYGIWNLSYWKNPTYDQLIEDAYYLSGMNVSESHSKYIEAQTILIDEAVALFLYDPLDVLPMSAKIKGEALNPSYPRVIFFYNLFE